MRCPGSVALAESLPAAERQEGSESEYAQEGTKAHALAAQALACSVDNYALLYADDVPEEMKDAIALYVSTVMASVKQGDEVMIERKVQLDADLWGTVDAAVVHIADMSVEVFDFKYGEGVVVEAEDNEQGGIYLLALAEYAKLRPARFTIVQPRARHKLGPVRFWEPHPGELVRLRQKATAAVRIGQGKFPPLAAGEWCQFCPAKGHCPELSRHAQLVAATDFEVVVEQSIPDVVAALPIGAVVSALGKAKVLEIYLKAMRSRVEKDLMDGRPVPGYKLVEKRPRRVWNDETEVAAWAASSGLSADDFLTDPQLKSPAQIEEVIGKKYLPEQLYTFVSSGATIAPEDDPRPALASAASADFAALPPATAGETDNQENS
jgi:hypothetical protein